MGGINMSRLERNILRPEETTISKNGIERLIGVLKKRKSVPELSPKKRGKIQSAINQAEHISKFNDFWLENKLIIVSCKQLDSIISLADLPKQVTATNSSFVLWCRGAQ